MFDYAERRSRLGKEMEQEGIDAMFLGLSSDLEYLTGLERNIPAFGNVSYAHGWVGGAFFRPGKEPTFLLPRMFAVFDLPHGALNLHPSLLPDFAGGMDAVEQALGSGAKTTGATVHVVTGDLDAGPVLLQERVPILPGDTVETLRGRIHEAEYRILPQAVRLMEARLAKSPAVG